MEESKLIFITGGVRSGKSSIAEKIAIKLADKINGNLHYVATGVASDSEMKERIFRHQEDRTKSGFSWKMWEEPFRIGKLSKRFTKKDIILLDCVTTLLNNEFFEHEENLDEFRLCEMKERILSGIMKVKNSCHTLIVVSNEILFDPLFSDFVIAYKKILGELHQRIVQEADQAFVVEVGVPVIMKGAPI